MYSGPPPCRPARARSGPGGSPGELALHADREGGAERGHAAVHEEDPLDPDRLPHRLRELAD
eukprot:11563785-Alexandrium_andersonii.AAC.1